MNILSSDVIIIWGFSYGSDSKESACNAGDQAPSLGQGEPLEKEMAIHSSILAWRIPWIPLSQRDFPSNLLLAYWISLSQ